MIFPIILRDQKLVSKLIFGEFIDQSPPRGGVGLRYLNNIWCNLQCKSMKLQWILTSLCEYFQQKKYNITLEKFKICVKPFQNVKIDFKIWWLLLLKELNISQNFNFNIENLIQCFQDIVIWKKNLWFDNNVKKILSQHSYF